MRFVGSAIGLVALCDPLSALAAAEIRPEAVHLESARPDPAGSPNQDTTDEAPPPRPYRKGVVLDATLGALSFLGKFGETAQTAPWLHAQLGYEVLSWWMLFGEGELAFTDTSGTEEPPKTRAFALFGGGGGTRVTARFGRRVGLYLQGSAGVMRAEVANRALALLGYRDAESFRPTFGGRVGFEFYAIDRHLGLGATAGLRDATGFSRVGDGGTPWLLDGGASLRYAF